MKLFRQQHSLNLSGPSKGSIGRGEGESAPNIRFAEYTE